MSLSSTSLTYFITPSQLETEIYATRNGISVSEHEHHHRLLAMTQVACYDTITHSEVVIVKNSRIENSTYKNIAF